MADDKSGIGAYVEKLDITIHDLLRYVYAGFAALLSVAFFHNQLAKDVVKSLEFPLTALAILALGAGIYVVSRYTIVLGLMYLYEVFNSKCKCFGRRLVKTRFQFFKSVFKLDLLESNDAYHVVREYRENTDQQPLLRAELQRQFHRQHSEIHMLYATALIFLLNTIALSVLWVSWGSIGISLAVFMIFSAVAVFADVSLSCRECCHLQRIGEKKIREVLENAGILTTVSTDSAITP